MQREGREQDVNDLLADPVSLGGEGITQVAQIFAGSRCGTIMDISNCFLE
jgi:hypothetical protein